MCLAVPARVNRSPGDMRRASTWAASSREVSLALMPEARLGDYVLVHAGFAISCPGRRGGARDARLLEEMGSLPARRIVGNPPKTRHDDRAWPLSSLPRRVPRRTDACDEVHRRVPRPGAARPLWSASGATPGRAAALHGVLRRPHPRHLALRAAPPCCPAGRAAVRARAARCASPPTRTSTAPSRWPSVPGVILATFGDMIRVPGSRESLQDATAGGRRRAHGLLGAGRAAASRGEQPGPPGGLPGRRLRDHRAHRRRLVLQAAGRGLDNFSVLSLHKLTPPATRAILDAGEVRLDGIIGPGHVTAIIGAARLGVPAARLRHRRAPSPASSRWTSCRPWPTWSTGREQAGRRWPTPTPRRVTPPGQPVGAGADGRASSRWERPTGAAWAWCRPAAWRFATSYAALRRGPRLRR